MVFIRKRKTFLIEHPAVLWTARLCVACYLLRFVVAARRGNNAAKTRAEAACWTAGWLMLIVHTAAAFHFVHGWSHEAAYAHTAARTAEVVGLHWGGGLWFNEATLVFWGIDVFLLWRSLNVRNGRHTIWLRAWRVFIHAFLAMMFLSATVVFGPAYWWIVAVVFLGILAGVRFGFPRSDVGCHGH